MTKATASSFTNSHIVLNDGVVTFKCSSDQDQWPWLALHPFDPIVVQTINYWVSVETGAARGTFDSTKWSALTQTEWTCGDPGTGHATHGVADAIGHEGSPRYRLTFFDCDGSLVYRMSGTGVVFQTRDFESWRDKAKQKITVPTATCDFQYAPADLVGVATQGESFLSPLIDHNNPSARALITKQNGFPPTHSYLSGSGDHVNSTHLADVARQFANILLGGEPRVITGGEMNFTRYVELGRPFHIELVDKGPSQNALSMNVKQADRVCATVEIRYEGGQ